MLLVGITFGLLLIAFLSYWWGAWKLAQYGFRVSTGTGVGVLLFFPFALYFSIFKLQEDGKEFPTAMMLFGLVSTIIITVVFWTPISFALTGRMDELSAPRGVAEAAIAEYGEESMAKKAAEKLKNMPVPEKKPDPTPDPTPTPTPSTNNAPTGTNNAAPPEGEASKEAAPKEAAPKETATP